MDFHSLNIDLCTILDALEDPIHIIDTDGILVFANLAWEKLIGLPRESAVGLYINDAISRGNQGFYFSIEKDEDSRAAQFTHFDQKLFDSIALTALEKRKLVSMFAYSSSKNRFMLTSIPLYKGDRLQYVLTWCRDLTNFSQLCDDLQSAIEKNKLISEELEFYRKMTTSQNMIGKCPQMIALMKTVEYVAGTDATVLITGESGVGKEVLTNEIYQRSGRKGKPFIRVNCASIPESLMESELFGYERGAFTAPVKASPGCSSWPTTAPCCWTRWGSCPAPSSPSCSAPCRSGRLSGWAGSAPSPSTCALSPPPIRIWRPWWRGTPSAGICITGST